MKTLNDVVASRSPESHKRIKEMAEELILETGLQIMRSEQKNTALQYDFDIYGPERADKSA